MRPRHLALASLAALGAACGSNGDSAAPAAPSQTADVDPCPGGVAPVDVAPAESAPLALHADERFLYWISADTTGDAPKKRLRRAPLGGGAPETLVETEKDLGSFALTGDTVTTLESDRAGGGSIAALPKAGGAPKVLLTVPASVKLDPFSLGADDASLYFLTHDSGAGLGNTVWRAPLGTTGGKARLGSVSLPVDQTLIGLKVDGTHVYWAMSAGLVHRIPKGGGQGERVVTETEGIGGWDLTESHVVYAVITEGGPLRRVAKQGGPPVAIGDSMMARYALAEGPRGLAYATLHDSIGLVSPDGRVDFPVTTGVTTPGSLLWVGRDLFWANTASVAAGGAVRRVCVR